MQGFNLSYLITNNKVIDVLPALQKATVIMSQATETPKSLSVRKSVERSSHNCTYSRKQYIPDTDLPSIPDIFIALLNSFKFAPKTSFPQLPICVGICHKALCFLEMTRIQNSLILLPSKSEPNILKIKDQMKGQKSFFSKKTQVSTQKLYVCLKVESDRAT